MNKKAVITGIEAYLPDYILTNEELSTMVDTSDEWIMSRVGIKERRILNPMSEKKHHDHHLFHHKHEHHDVDVGTAEDVEKIMRKFDRESNTRIWSGKAAMLIRLITVAFSVFCICSTLFSVAALEKRLTSFLAFIVVIGYLNYPFNKHHVRENYLPWYDILLMGLGAASFLFYYFGYDSLVKVLTSASRMTPALTVVGVVGILVLMELCRRCVGLPILCVLGVLLADLMYGIVDPRVKLE